MNDPSAYTVVNNRDGKEVTEPMFSIAFSDPHAAPAVLAYAASIREENPELFRDLIARYNEKCTCAEGITPA